MPDDVLAVAETILQKVLPSVQKFFEDIKGLVVEDNLLGTAPCIFEEVGNSTGYRLMERWADMLVDEENLPSNIGEIFALYIRCPQHQLIKRFYSKAPFNTLLCTKITGGGKMFQVS